MEMDKAKSWPAAFSLGSALVSGWASRYATKVDMRVAQANHSASLRVGAANNALANQQAAIENRLRAGANAVIMAQIRTENKLRSIGNRRILMRTQDEHAQAAENFLRSQEAMTQGDLETQIAAAEQRGAYAASTALAGTLGSTVEGMEKTLKLKQARQFEYRERQGQYASLDQLRQMAGIVPMGISQLDTGTSVANLDYGVSFSRAQTLGPEKLLQAKPTSNFFTDGWSWALRNEDGFRQVGNTISSWFTPRKTVPDYIGAEY
jgi:hypothetical protein